MAKAQNIATDVLHLCQQSFPGKDLERVLSSGLASFMGTSPIENLITTLSDKYVYIYIVYIYVCDIIYIYIIIYNYILLYICDLCVTQRHNTSPIFCFPPRCLDHREGFALARHGQVAYAVRPVKRPFAAD